MKAFFKHFFRSQQIPVINEIEKLNREIQIFKSEIYRFQKSIIEIAIQDYLFKHLFNNNRYDNKKLNKYEHQTYSQYGEDGIIAEIFKRLEIEGGYFVEFGVENGLECNTTNLLVKNWKGLWIEASENYFNQIKQTFKNEIKQNRLKTLNCYVTPENINEILRENKTPQNFDLLSIDIDYNDFHIWKAITDYQPKVVVIEYNAAFRPNNEYVVKYEKSGNKGIFTSHFGSSLYSLELLGKEKGYSLVGCSFSGVNAFFVRNDFIKDRFEFPYTAQNHYEPPRYFLYCNIGHEKGWGDFHNTLE